jgi:hypothetical protein
MAEDKLNPVSTMRTSMTALASINELIQPDGHYGMVCTDSDGNVLWDEELHNILPTVGANQILTAGVSGSTPAYMGLISGASTPTLAVGDTMSAHSGWLEANGTNAPNYGTTRPTLTFGASASSAIATTSTNSYVFTNSGTVSGGFICFGSGAAAGNTSTTGILMSEGTLTTAQPVISGNTVTVSYTLTI